ncbi:hypothetical protein CGL27_26440 [Streptomyces sp. 11-1-2]|nr:hypothetical protein CGL27_26440 [Streptomyces sp. 11-1-2]
MPPRSAPRPLAPRPVVPRPAAPRPAAPRPVVPRPVAPRTAILEKRAGPPAAYGGDVATTRDPSRYLRRQQ